MSQYLSIDRKFHTKITPTKFQRLIEKKFLTDNIFSIFYLNLTRLPGDGLSN